MIELPPFTQTPISYPLPLVHVPLISYLLYLASYTLPLTSSILPLTSYLVSLISYLLPLTPYLLSLIFHILPHTPYLLPLILYILPLRGSEQKLGSAVTCQVQAWLPLVQAMSIPRQMTTLDK